MELVTYKNSPLSPLNIQALSDQYRKDTDNVCYNSKNVAVIDPYYFAASNPMRAVWELNNRRELGFDETLNSVILSHFDKALELLAEIGITADSGNNGKHLGTKGETVTVNCQLVGFSAGKKEAFIYLTEQGDLLYAWKGGIYGHNKNDEMSLFANGDKAENLQVRNTCFRTIKDLRITFKVKGHGTFFGKAVTNVDIVEGHTVEPENTTKVGSDPICDWGLEGDTEMVTEIVI